MASPEPWASLVGPPRAAAFSNQPSHFEACCSIGFCIASKNGRKNSAVVARGGTLRSNHPCRSQRRPGNHGMTKQELGTKRLCAHCGAKFYDLHHSPIICPKCDTVFEVAPVSSRFTSERAPAPEAKDEAQFVSLGDGEAAESKDDEVEPDDAGLIEEVEEDGAVVTDFIEDDEDHE
jgi:uncharacterized protein (TIGR02300 family)